MLALWHPEGLRFEKKSLRVMTTGSEEGRIRIDDSRAASVKIATGISEQAQPMDRILDWVTNVPERRN